MDQDTAPFCKSYSISFHVKNNDLVTIGEVVLIIDWLHFLLTKEATEVNSFYVKYNVTVQISEPWF